jgi:hypothetical protein
MFANCMCSLHTALFGKYHTPWASLEAAAATTDIVIVTADHAYISMQLKNKYDNKPCYDLQIIVSWEEPGHKHP